MRFKKKSESKRTYFKNKIFFLSRVLSKFRVLSFLFNATKRGACLKKCCPLRILAVFCLPLSAPYCILAAGGAVLLERHCQGTARALRGHAHMWFPSYRWELRYACLAARVSLTVVDGCHLCCQAGMRASFLSHGQSENSSIVIRIVRFRQI